MVKRALLSSAISAAAHGKPPAPVPAPASMPEVEPPVAAAPKEPAASRAPSRKGKKAVYSWVEPNVHRSLRSMNLDTGRSVDELVGEAVRALLKQNGYLK